MAWDLYFGYGAAGSFTLTLADVQDTFQINGVTYSGWAIQSASGTIDGYDLSLGGDSNPHLIDYHPEIDGTLPPDGLIGNPILMNDSLTGESVTIEGSPDGNGQLIVTDLNTGASSTLNSEVFSGGPPCFAEGTLIETPRGGVPIESLEPGDLVTTASGATRPVRWIGAGDVNLRRRPRPERPVIVRAGALAPGLPRRDLVLSPGHALFFDDALVTAGRLVNGATILRDDTRETITYWHFELDSHDVVHAEGVPVETYRDDANRRFLSRQKGTPLAVRAEPVAPHVEAGPRLAAIRDWVWRRAEQLGARRIEDVGVSVEADGLALTPVSVADGRFTFRAPEGTRSLRLVSRVATPAEATADNPDERSLGVCVRDLVVDGAPVALDDPRLAEGWHEPERNEAGDVWRWTMGDAALPPGREIAFEASWLATVTPIHPPAREVGCADVDFNAMRRDPPPPFLRAVS
jgi:Hint domain